MVSVQFNHSFVSSSLGPHGLQHPRLPCLSPTPEIAQTHVHGVNDAIQPSDPLSSPSHISLNRKSRRIDKLPELISNFSKVSECKFIMQAPIIFLCNNCELVRLDIKNTVTYIITYLTKYV